MLNSRTKWVLALLVTFLVTLACSKKEETKTEEMKQTAPAEQKSTAMEQAKEQTPAESTAAGDQGKAVYQNTCASCHETGVSGAPKIGDKTAWDSLIAKGKDQLVQSVINGKGAMPPKAGNPGLSEEEIRAAVDYMVDQAR
jgi:cytochrome c5